RRRLGSHRPVGDRQRVVQARAPQPGRHRDRRDDRPRSLPDHRPRVARRRRDRAHLHPEVRTAMTFRSLFVSGLAAVVLSTAAAAVASGPPVGPLRAGPHSTVTTPTGEAFAIALPNRSGGRVWRIARPFDSTVLHEVSEGNVGAHVVLVFKTTRAGQTTLALALTRGETPKALEARTFNVVVR